MTKSSLFFLFPTLGSVSFKNKLNGKKGIVVLKGLKFSLTSLLASKNFRSNGTVSC